MKKGGESEDGGRRGVPGRHGVNPLMPSGLSLNFSLVKSYRWGFPGGAVIKNLPANAGDTGSIPGPGRSHMPRRN